jgi:membrane-associated phospholipid phosphatase
VSPRVSHTIARAGDRRCSVLTFWWHVFDRCARGQLQLSCRPMYGTTRLAPPRASVIAIIAVVATAAVGALAWTPRRPAGVDAWAAHTLTVTQGSFPYRFASRLDDTMRVLPVLAGSLAIAVVAWLLLRRRDVVVASLLVAPATVADEQLLKLAGRRSLGVPIFTFPSGRAALATSLVLLLVLVLHTAGVRPVVRALVGILGFVYVLAMAWARVATGQHLLTDVIGAMSMGVAVTLVTLLMLTAWRQGNSNADY